MLPVDQSVDLVVLLVLLDHDDLLSSSKESVTIDHASDLMMCSKMPVDLGRSWLLVVYVQVR